MRELFADLPEACDNTLVIAQRCAFIPQPRQPILPAFPTADGDERGDGVAPRGARPGSTRASRGSGSATTTARPYRERLEFELGTIIQMGFAGYFLIVADFIQWAKRAGHPGRARARLGRRLGRRLGVDDHRSRPAALRPAVRALPQSRARVDAGFRHRFLPGPARRGDPLRPAEIRPRPGRADHHLRQAAGARGAARCRPGARRCPTARSTGCASWCRTTRRIRSRLDKAIAGEPALAAGARRRRGGGAADRDRAEARRALPPRLDPCRRRRDRRPAAGRAGAALSRPALRHAGDPVQHEMGRARGARQIRLSRPQDADRAGPLPANCWRRAASSSTSSTLPLDDRATFELAERAATRSGCSSSKARACATCSKAAPRPLRGHHRRRSRSIGPARWRTSRATSRSSTARKRPTTCTRRSRRS